MIEVRNLTKTFDGFTALDRLTLTVPQGSVYGLVGPNGAGKSTIIRHLTGSYRADSGECLINGEPVYGNPAVKSLVGYIPDELFHYPSSNVKDLRALYKGLYGRFDDELFERLGKMFDLSLKTPLRKFSKGMRKQAFFWLTLCLRPKALILDEPVDGLDPVMRRGVWSAMLERAAEDGATVLVSSHNLRELEDVCDHVGIMHKGKMLIERNLSELQDGVVKLQIAWREGEERELPPGVKILHSSAVGRVKTYIVSGRTEETESAVKALGPVLFEAIPLTLEEIFLYEMGGEGYEAVIG